MASTNAAWSGCAVVTGAGSGLGAAMVGRFAEVGMAIVALDIDEARAEQQAQRVRDQGGRAIALGVDVADPAAMARAAEAARAEFGGCNVLCANVGVQQFGAIDKLTANDWRWVLDVNVLGVVNTVGAFLPLLRESRGLRRVLVTASSSVLTPGVRMAAYIASKYAVMGYGETLRMELAPEDIGVSVFFPAGMASRHLESSRLARPEALGPSVLERADIDAMLASRQGTRPEPVVTPEHATRNLLADLVANQRFIVSHGAYRDELVDRCDDLIAAFDRAQDD
ncbi:SDR family NAD(P)-dependent oxidoreductase [Caulobacter soli]|uniref:SDR family NAD(P)-dependent oxidoreductase n=1 Tax=Caulobacter soli TaxID=2708539 RepID=UPI0013EA7E57|nr:SDR family NAD(P)-dependent oxidoreductase [Caulobacter soli]